MSENEARIAANKFFARAGESVPTIMEVVHPDARFDLEDAERRISNLAEPGISSTPKSLPDRPGEIAFSLLEGVLESEVLDDSFKPPMHIVTAYSPSTSDWRVIDVVSTPWG